ncbi:MAG: radical SAM protein, partial [Rikenellaceae bacterium]
IHTAVDTSGYASVSDFRRVVESKSVDLFLFDIKVIDSILHKDVTGCDNEPILENLEMLIKSGIRTILRLPMIPQVSFTKLNIKKLISFLDNIKSSNITELTLLPYHNTANAKYARFHYQCAMSDQIKSLDPSELTELQILLENRGWKVSIG